MAVTIVLTSGSSWQVPEDWDSSNNTIECIGGGGGGREGASSTFTLGGGGGGGGEYARVENLSLSGGATISYSVGSGGGVESNGGNTWFESVSTCLANGGNAGNESTGGSGGSGGVGDLTYSGGAGGGSPSEAGGGGGGAGGPQGAGLAGQSGSGTDGGVGGDGGAGFGGDGGVGGDFSSNSGENGGAGTEITGTVGSGGGGGGGSWFSGSAGDGGNYGAGGGGGGEYHLAGVGAPGVIVITYEPKTGEIATGDTTAQPSQVTGSATRAVKASGAVQAQAASVASSATRVVTGNGSVAASAASVSGSARRAVITSGDVSSGQSVATGEMRDRKNLAGAGSGAATVVAQAFKFAPVATTTEALSFASLDGNTRKHFFASVLAVSVSALSGGSISPATGSVAGRAEPRLFSDETYIIRNPKGFVTARAKASGSLSFSGETFARAVAQAALSVTFNSTMAEVLAASIATSNAVRKVDGASSLLGEAVSTADAIRLYWVSSQQKAGATASVEITTKFTPTFVAVARGSSFGNNVKRSRATSFVAGKAISNAAAVKKLAVASNIYARSVWSVSTKVYQIAEGSVASRALAAATVTVYGKVFVSSEPVGRANHSAILSFVAFIHPPPIKATARAVGFLRGVLTGDAPRNRTHNVPSEYRKLNGG